MKILLQKVTRASVEVDSAIVGEIQHGYVLFIGFRAGDTLIEIEKLVLKICKLRLFAAPGSNSFMDQTIHEVAGSLLIVSQFTLYGDCTKGTRPSFTEAAKPADALPLYNALVERFRKTGLPIQTGVFGAHMAVNLVNDGPITLLLEH